MEKEKLSKEIDISTKKRKTVHAKRIGPTLTPDRSRVLMRPFFPVKKEIARRILLQVMSLSDVEVSDLLNSKIGMSM